jgi:hypothetical protein
MKKKHIYITTVALCAIGTTICAAFWSTKKNRLDGKWENGIQVTKSEVKAQEDPPQVYPTHARLVPESVRLTNLELAKFLDPFGKGRCPADLTERIPSVNSKEEIVAVVALLLDTQDGDTPRNEAINLLRRSGYLDLERDLIEVARNKTERPRFRAFAIQHLGISLVQAEREPLAHRTWNPLYVCDLLSDFLKNEPHEVQREALYALIRAKDDRASYIIAQGLNSPQWEGSRDLLIRGALELNMDSKIAEIRPFAYSEDVNVRVAALNALAQWKDEASRPAMEEALTSKVARIKNAGEVALFQLSQPQEKKSSIKQ